MFEAVLALKNKLPPGHLLEVAHGDYLWNAQFDWQPPLRELALSKAFSKPLPRDFLAFLNQVANGCMLYYDSVYGQWGYQIYGIEALLSKQALWARSFGDKWRDSFIAFSEIYGEAHVLLFDLNSPTDDSASFTIREGNPHDVADDWPVVSRSFHEWLDDLITAQGAKYWEWK